MVDFSSWVIDKDNNALVLSVSPALGPDEVFALRQALGEEVPDELALPRFTQPLAIRFFTAQPGPLPTGRVRRIGSLDAVLASEGVVQADTYLQVGETIRPVRLDGDRCDLTTSGTGRNRPACRRCCAEKTGSCSAATRRVQRRTGCFPAAASTRARA
jgi:hypothetical protein